MSSTEKILIKDITKEGGKFRQSNRTEQLFGAMTSYGRRRRIRFHPRIRLASIKGVKCVVVDELLRDENEILLEFLMGFAGDNQLEIEQRDSSKIPLGSVTPVQHQASSEYSFSVTRFQTWLFAAALPPHQ
ncbi:MAG: DUF3579 domain-containing protein [Methylophaga sp.]|nr:DUF3579 domain-containing protein [Methylophaga sp.]